MKPKHEIPWRRHKEVAKKNQKIGLAAKEKEDAKERERQRLMQNKFSIHDSGGTQLPPCKHQGWFGRIW